MDHTQRGPNVSVATFDAGFEPGYAPPLVTTPLFRIDDRARPAPALARFALGPTSLVIAFGLFYGGYISQFAAMCIVGAGLIAFQWANVLSNGSRAAYDRAAVTLMAKGKESELGARLQSAIPFRLFGSSAEWSARRGAVLTAAGKYEEAAVAWALSVAGYTRGMVPRSVALGFASAAFEAGWNRDSSRAYRSLFEGDPELPRVRLRLAHALARLGEDLDEADGLLDAEEKRKRDDVELTIARAVWLAATNKPKAARAKLSGIVDVPAALKDEVDGLRETPKNKKKR